MAELYGSVGGVGCASYVGLVRGHGSVWLGRCSAYGWGYREEGLMAEPGLYHLRVHVLPGTFSTPSHSVQKTTSHSSTTKTCGPCCPTAPMPSPRPPELADFYPFFFRRSATPRVDAADIEYSCPVEPGLHYM